MTFEAAITALALLRKKPVCLTSRSISTGLAPANACGFGYLRKSDLVTMLTRASVDCAESIVAINSSKAFVKSSEHFAFGYICLRRTTMSFARSCFFVPIGGESDHDHALARAVYEDLRVESGGARRRARQSSPALGAGKTIANQVRG